MWLCNQLGHLRGGEGEIICHHAPPLPCIDLGHVSLLPNFITVWEEFTLIHWFIVLSHGPPQIPLCIPEACAEILWGLAVGPSGLSDSYRMHFTHKPFCRLFLFWFVFLQPSHKKRECCGYYVDLTVCFLTRRQENAGKSSDTARNRFITCSYHSCVLTDAALSTSTLSVLLLFLIGGISWDTWCSRHLASAWPKMGRVTLHQ